MKCLSIHSWPAGFVENHTWFVFIPYLLPSHRTRHPSAYHFSARSKNSSTFFVVAFPIRTVHLSAALLVRIVVCRTSPPLRVQGEILRPGLRIRPNLLNSCHESHVQFFGTPPLSRYSCIDHRRFLPSLSGNFN